MKSLKEQGIEEQEKQRCIDEIHLKPEVKKTFVICEIFTTIDWISNIIFFTLMVIAIWTHNLSNFVEFSDITVILDLLGGPVVVAIFIVVKLLISRLKKKHMVKLQVFEDAGLEEIKKAKAEGTYQQGPKHSLAYRVFRAIRWISVLIILGALLVAVFVKIL